MLNTIRQSKSISWCTFSRNDSLLQYNWLMWLVLLAITFSSCATRPLSKSGQRKLVGKTFVITGASSGFGRGVAEQLGQYHANVVLAARRGDLLEEVAGRIRTAGGKAIVVVTDVSNPRDIQRLADTAKTVFGKADFWINDAGVGAIGRFEEIPLEDYSKLIDVNLKGVVYGSYAAMKLFKAQGHGKLINVGSVESAVPLAYHATYGSTKAAVRALGNVLYQEIRLSGNKKNIKIVTIMPWAVDTPFWGHAANYSGGTARMAAMDGPEKVVNAIIFSSLHRKRELPVGWKAWGSYISHRIFPHFTERISANIAHHSQIEMAPPAPATSGAVLTPMESGTGVDDGVRKRMKEERKQRKQQHK
ncbi:SDR family oxidoreductase [Dyadobacter sp. CY326]|uniref:SDR family NAD(P)-dependent oxidoreductase n=1 Tax=Dyadobacter sp. CY326 TaxID=2907300 RepID=UPI001F1E85BF|nr:SDR family NAD(P)-dependent oxidoreductase [Dyadobacter sp. CY326]MCE7064874.1 SDR family NAD(P)-dependent oxidoreductase [Dyadobacter sp. CY326]